MYRVSVVSWSTYNRGENIDVENYREAAQLFVQKCIELKIDIADIIEHGLPWNEAATLRKNYSYSVYLFNLNHLKHYL